MRAGRCDLDESIVTQMSACAQAQAHIQYEHWGLSSGVPEQPVNIQHFIGVLVVGARNGQRADTQWNLKWLKPYTQMYGVLIQVREWVGSDAHMYCNFLTHILLHNMGVEKFHGFFLIVSLRFLYGRVLLVVRRSGRLFSSRSCLTKLVHVVLAIQPFLYHCRIIRFWKQKSYNL